MPIVDETRGRRTDPTGPCPYCGDARDVGTHGIKDASGGTTCRISAAEMARRPPPPPISQPVRAKPLLKTGVVALRERWACKHPEVWT